MGSELFALGCIIAVGISVYHIVMVVFSKNEDMKAAVGVGQRADEIDLERDRVLSRAHSPVHDPARRQDQEPTVS